MICHGVTFGDELNNDRIGAILSEITQINNNVKALTGKVDGIEKKVDDVIKKEGELKNNFGDVTKQVSDVKNQVSTVNDRVATVKNQVSAVNDQVAAVNDHVASVKNQVAVVKNQVAAVQNQVSAAQNAISDVRGKLEKVDNDVIHNTWLLGWSFVGWGTDESNDEQHWYKDGTTLKECIEFCQIDRSFRSGEFNGVVWGVDAGGRCFCQKNDRGHRTNYDWLHFRAQ